MSIVLSYILVFSQFITLGVWASAPMELNQGQDATHVHLDLHQHLDSHEHATAQTPHDHADDHEHSENCHVHLSVQLSQDSHMNTASTPKAILREALILSHNSLKQRPPVPPPSTLNN